MIAPALSLLHKPVYILAPCLQGQLCLSFSDAAGDKAAAPHRQSNKPRTVLVREQTRVMAKVMSGSGAVYACTNREWALPARACSSLLTIHASTILLVVMRVAL